MRALKQFNTGFSFVLAFSALVLSHSAKAEVDEMLQDFATVMAQKYDFDPAFIIDSLQNANKDQAILDAIARPWEAKPWHQYYPIFLTDKRLNKGIAFWQEHAATLARAEQVTGVPAQIIVAIIGVETFYGSYKGKYPVLDALYTLGFHYPPRSKFFKSELEQYFLLTREEGFKLPDIKGSYAGAMGWGQFISSSYRHYAVDFDNDGVRDLLNNPKDAIGSVANYFKQHGWKAGQPVAFKVDTQLDPESPEIAPLLSKKLAYKHNWQELQGAGVHIGENTIAPETAAKLFAFEQPKGKEFWVGLENFYVITRYNHSPLYAMVVYQLSEQLRHARLEQ